MLKKEEKIRGPSLRVAVVIFGQVFYEDELDPKSWTDLVSLASRKKEMFLQEKVK